MRVSAGGVAGALFVADQDVTQLLRVEKRVVDGQHGTAGDAEDHVDVEFLQRTDDRLGAGELLRCNSFRLYGGRLSAVSRSRRLLRWPRGGCAHGDSLS